MIGTRYCATHEALMHPLAAQRLLEADGDHTQRTRVFDIARGYDWPAAYTRRARRRGAPARVGSSVGAPVTLFDFTP